MSSQVRSAVTVHGSMGSAFQPPSGYTTLELLEDLTSEELQDITRERVCFSSGGGELQWFESI